MSNSIRRSRSRSRSRSRNRNSHLELNEFFSNGTPLSGDRLWAARINEWVNSGLLNVEYNNDNLIKIDNVNSFEDYKYEHKKLLKTNTIMIVQNDNIIGFGKHSKYNRNSNKLFFTTYISKDALNNYENYYTYPGNLENIDSSYEFYILKTPGRGGAIMRKSKKSRKSRKARKSRKM